MRAFEMDINQATLTIFSVLGIVFVAFKRKFPHNSVLKILNRWFLWIFFSIFIAQIAIALGCTSRPWGIIFMMAFLSWFIFETMYAWFAIGLINRSQIPLFPRFKVSHNNQKWPNQKDMILVRDWLREHRFTSIGTFQAQLIEDFKIYTRFFEDETRKIRFQAIFIPKQKGEIVAFLCFLSQAKSGVRYVTDNISLPYGGFYPQNLKVVRKPLMQSVEKLYKLHESRIQGDASIIPWGAEDEVLCDVNEQQSMTEQFNIQRKFVYPRHLQEKYGIITQDGRFRIWVEIWLLNYLGISLT